MDKPVKVLIVDDSAFMRHMIGKLLAADPQIEVADTARDGVDALEKAGRLDVDVLTLDVEMPRLDGLATLERLMRERPVPVVMVSSSTREGADATIRALTLGAVDFVCKPSGAISLNMEMVGDELRSKVKRAARAACGGAASGALLGLRQLPVAGTTSPAMVSKTPGRTIRVVAIGSSTGGPRALHEVLPRLGQDFPVPIVVVQHMPRGFTRSLAEHLDEGCAIAVREAQSGENLRAGRAYVAPGDFHLTVRKSGMVELDQKPTRHGVRPSVDVTFESLASSYGSGCLAVVLTGMGCDGAEGALRIKKAGGQVMAEHESTCVVYGMPRSAVENGAADRVLPLPQVADAIEQIVWDSRVTQRV